MKSSVRVALAITSLVLTLPAQAQFRKPQDAVKYRQSVMSVMGFHMGRLGAVAKGEAKLDPAQANLDASVVRQLSTLPWIGFDASTEDVKSKALPEIWLSPDKFKAAGEKMGQAAVQLQAAAATGDLDRIRAAVGETGKTCKACHDDFKE